MAKTVEDLEREAAADAEFASDDTDDASESLLYNDLVNVVDLLKKCAILFEFLSDADLCKSVTKKERGIMEKMAARIYEVTSEVENQWEDA